MAQIVPGSVLDKIVGMIYGHALGDAVGLAGEFKFRRDAPQIVFPYTDSIRKFPPCDWTEDTDHMILCMQSLAANQMKLYPCDIAARLIAWTRSGFPSCGDTHGQGLSTTMAAVINHSQFMENPIAVAQSINESSHGHMANNGSLMRTSIIGTLTRSMDVLNHARDLCTVTHADTKCIRACVLQSMLIHGLVYAPPMDDYCDIILRNALTAAADNHNKELHDYVDMAYTEPISALGLDDMKNGGMSYVYRCMAVSVYALQVISFSIENSRKPSFPKFITKVANECGDADTNCAVSGAVMGAYLGYHAIQQQCPEWIEALPARVWLNEIITDYISTLTSMHASTTSPITSTTPVGI